VAVAALALGAVPQALSQGAIAVAIDVDVSGNDARTVASIQNCARMDVGSDLEIDVVLPDPGIAADVGIQAYEFNLQYDPDILTVSAQDQDLLLKQASGSNLIPLSDFLPDSDGNFLSAAADRSAAFQIEPDGSYEVGPGVLSRLTLTAQAKGRTDLTFSGAILVDVDKNSIPIGELVGATVSVDTPCTDPPPPTVLPASTTPGPSETPDAPNQTTDPDSGTPGTAGGTPEPGDSPAASGTPGEGSEDQTPGASTPGPGTPVLDGTPPSASGGWQSGDDSDGGLSGAAWVGIGVAIAAAILAAAGGAWYALQRRKVGPS
jgi:hypothetical protein